MKKKSKKEKTLFIKQTKVVEEELFLEEGGQVRVLPPNEYVNLFELKVPWIQSVSGKTVGAAVKLALSELKIESALFEERLREHEDSVKRYKDCIAKQNKVLQELQRYLDS